MQFPSEVEEIINRVVTQHPADIPAATQAAVVQVKELACYPELREACLYSALQQLIWEARRAANRKTKSQNKDYTHAGPAKVNPANSRSVQAICGSLYDYYIAGTTLGLLRGDQLEGVAVQEETIAQGRLFNARLCRRLMKLVPAKETVQDAVKEPKLRKVWREVWAEIYPGTPPGQTG